MGLRVRSGYWHYRIFINGEEVEAKSTGLAASGSNRKAAQKMHDYRRTELLAQMQTPRPQAILFADAAAEFIRWCGAVEYRAKPNTARRIKTSFASLAEFLGGKLVVDLTAGDVEQYKEFRIREHGVRDITLRHDLHALSLFFQYARKARWAVANPVEDVKIPSDSEAIRIYVISEEEAATYFERAASNGNLYDVHRLILLQGCRPEEVMGLRQADVDLKAAKITIPGGKSRAARRTLDLCGESLEILSRRLARPGTWVFPSARKPGQHLTKLNNAHDEVCRDAGLSFVPYDLRHTFATRLAQSGCDLATLAAILGHSSLRMVMRYVHPTAEHRKEAMRKFEAGLKPRLKVVG